ncbi:MAG: hypothetical protein M1820_005772 [Bogoriella megaspora]|nr:MAG: hypothetical protein M1820_005772 [Bogoriella megaspora]
MVTTLFLLLATHCLSAFSIFILVPLYIYPETPSTWQPLLSAISASPSVRWQIIVNPASGPGTNSTNPYPDSSYTAAIASLNEQPNVQTIGYIDSAYGNTAVSSIETQIDAYAQWASYTAQNISLSGIFFDDMNQSTALYDFYDSIATYTRQHIKSASTPTVVFNPGTPSTTADEQKFFSYSDTMLEFENPASNYKNQTTIDTIPKAYWNKSAIVLHDFRESESVLDSWVQTMKADGIQSVYFTSDPSYNALNGTLLTQLATAVAGS